MTVIFGGLTKSLSLQVALTSMGIWAFSLWNCTQIEIEHLPLLGTICLIAWQTWVYTGLFITAHDAMHGSIHTAPNLNQAIGKLCLWLYAGFEYHQLRVKHHRHHRYPASDRDPDFHDGRTPHFWGWYGQFVHEHLNWRQLINLVLLSGIYVEICQFSVTNLLLFWIVPAWLSSLQLFYFGTFLPHREPIDGYLEPHRADTITRSRWWSLISCYHFGYHREHHESPQIPWWQLYRD
jgi:beta-carotene/zeaxanthin 4-ketolase